MQILKPDGTHLFYYLSARLPAAVRAFSELFGAARAEGAFERADARIERFGRKVDSAAFATGPEFQHVIRLRLFIAILLSGCLDSNCQV